MDISKELNPNPNSTLSLSPPIRVVETTNELEISEESRLFIEKKQRAAALAVPTNDNSVRSRLRRLGEPVTMFGEREMDRRDRLRMIMARLDSQGQLEEEEEGAGMEDEGKVIQYPFYTEGSTALLKARYWIAKDSLLKSVTRLRRAKRKRDDHPEDLDSEIHCTKRHYLDSDIADHRPLSGCSFSSDGNFLATSSFSGDGKIWSIMRPQDVNMIHVSSLNRHGHTERATDIAFSPTSNIIATASADRTAKLWNTHGTLLYTLTGHLDSLARVAFHPSGKYLGTASFDKSWRFWDTETGDELLYQDGHSRGVYGLAFHPDGSLAASCGLDAVARVWDLRLGRSILALEGHVKPVHAVSFSPNGYHLATGGQDNTCKIWDLRKKGCVYTIPAHQKPISQIKFEPQDGQFFVTASHDTTAKVWSSRDFKHIEDLSGHDSIVTSVDVAADGQSIATVSHDRTIKLWSTKNDGKQNNMDVE